MNEEQLKAAIQKEIDALQSNLKQYSTKQDMDNAVKEMKDRVAEMNVKGVSDKLDKLSEEMDKLGVEIQKYGETEKNKPQSIEDILRKHQPALKTVIESDKGSYKIIIPKTAVTTALVGSNPAGLFIPEIMNPGVQMPNMAMIMGSRPLPQGNNHAVGYWDRTTSTRNVSGVAENNTTTDSAAAWTYSTKPIEKIFDWIPFTRESVYDIAWMAAEINGFIRENLLTKEDYYLLQGTGTTPYIQGLYDIATAFDATDYAGKFIKGNLFNLLLCVASKISNGVNSRFKATHVVLNDTDFISMIGNQNSFGSYDFPPFARLNPDGSLNVAGMTVISNSNITAGTALVCDITKQVRYAGNVEIEIGLNGNDIIYDRQTLVGRIREAVVIPTNNAGGFYKIENITADVAEISQGA